MSERVTLHGPEAQENFEGMDPIPTTAEPTPGSIVARLRAEAQAQQQTKTKDIRVGGEFKSLFIRYRPLSAAAMDKFVAARQGVKVQDISATAATMDMMARACVCVLGKVGDEEEVLGDDDGPVKLDFRLAQLLAMPVPEGTQRLTSHDVIQQLFGNNGAMLAAHGDVLAEWMQDPSTQNGDADRSVGED
jgi:hypothetical protein